MHTALARTAVVIGASALLALASCTSCTSCAKGTKGGVTTAASAGIRPLASEEIVELAYEGGLKPGWQDWGWSPRDVKGPGPASIHFTNSGGWILAKPGLGGSFGSLVFRARAPAGEAEFLEVRVESASQTTFPRVLVAAQHRAEVGGGWVEVKINLTELNPEGAPFDRIVFRAFRSVPDEVTLLDKIGFTKADPNAAVARLSPSAYGAQNSKSVKMRIACGSRATKVSSDIFGIAGAEKDKPHVFKLGATVRRWGGNPTSTYNWELHTWNLGNDWFWENSSAAHYDEFLALNAANGVRSALTIPMMGWVAKDATSSAFPVATFGAQEKTDQYRPEAGNGVKPGGQKIAPGPQTRTSVAISAAWVKKWVEAIRAADAKTGKRSVHQYILDNEPALWSSTHRALHPEATSYDELLDKTIAYGRAVRDADPDAVIAGPAEWGWNGYLFSAKDAEAGIRAKPDRTAHGDVPLVEYYLSKLRDYEKQNGVRILDVLVLHYSPQAENVYGGGGATDANGAALRIRSTRSLWDPNYTDESWIKEKIRLLPRMREWIDKNYPGRGISIGEWNFGGEQHMSGAIATAEALGRFAEHGVTSAYYWTFPPESSPVIQAFLAYRNFDGNGGRFLDYYVPSAVTGGGASMFVSRDADGKRAVAVAINPSPDKAVIADIDIAECGALTQRQAHTFMRGAAGFVHGPIVKGGNANIEQVLPPYSITVIDAQLASSMHGAVAP